MHVGEALSPCLRCTIQRLAIVYSQTRQNHYQVLGVTKSASTPDIKAAYFEKSKQLHPDIKPNDPEQHDKFVELNEAYAVLSKPLTRRDYDLELAGVRVSPSRVRVYRTDAHNPFGAGGSTNHDFYGFSGSQAGSSSYYSVKSFGRVKNSTVLVGCLILLIGGTIIHVSLVKLGGMFSRKNLDEKDRRIGEIYNQVKKRARENGNKKQMEVLRQNYRAMTKSRQVMSTDDSTPKAAGP